KSAIGHDKFLSSTCSSSRHRAEKDVGGKQILFGQYQCWDSYVEKVSKTSGMQENEIGNDNEHSIHEEENLHSSYPIESIIPIGDGGIKRLPLFPIKFKLYLNQPYSNSIPRTSFV
nr:hypothetical protein [Tanacetum cinerariifolium]